MISKSMFLLLIVSLIIIFFYGMYKEGELNTKFKETRNLKKTVLGFLNIFNILLILILVISYIWVFPNVLIFKSCYTVEKYILINPCNKYYDLNFDYGNNILYVINESDENLEIIPLQYGYINYDKENYEQIISTNSAQKVEISRFDFINEMVPKYIRTKSGPRTYYYIGCLSSNEINFMLVK